MPNRQKKDPIFTPELIRIMKIFGLLSIGIVLILSFFNTKRANNTGKESAFTVSASNRLYFLNMRTMQYDREVRSDAGMTLFRHGKRDVLDTIATLDLVLILNTGKDEAYLYLEPGLNQWPIQLKIQGENSSKEFVFENGNKEMHKKYVNQIEPLLQETNSFYLYKQESWVPIWDNPGELDVLKTVLEDYSELLR